MLRAEILKVPIFSKKTKTKTKRRKNWRSGPHKTKKNWRSGPYKTKKIGDPGPTKRKKLALWAPQNEQNLRSGPHKMKIPGEGSCLGCWPGLGLVAGLIR